MLQLRKANFFSRSTEWQLSNYKHNLYVHLKYVSKLNDLQNSCIQKHKTEISLIWDSSPKLNQLNTDPDEIFLKSCYIYCTKLKVLLVHINNFMYIFPLTMCFKQGGNLRKLSYLKILICLLSFFVFVFLFGRGVTSDDDQEIFDN